MKKGTMITLTYTFIFSQEANIWNHVYQFENDLADFFASNGLECEVIKTVEGSMGGRMLMIERIDSAAEKLTNTKGANIQKQLPQGGSQKSANIIKNLTNSLGKARK